MGNVKKSKAIRDGDDLERSWGENADSPRISRMLSTAVICFLYLVLDSQLSTFPLPSEKETESL